MLGERWEYTLDRMLPLTTKNIKKKFGQKRKMVPSPFTYFILIPASEI